MRLSAVIVCAVSCASLSGRADEVTPDDWDDPKPPSKCSSSAFMENRFGYVAPPPSAEQAPPMLDWALFQRATEAPTTAHHAAPGSMFTGEEDDGGPRKPSTLSPDAVQGAVRPHMNEVRFCFQKAQQQNPSLEGRVFVRFTVAQTGQVLSSDVESSTLEHPAVEKCLTSAVRRWTFPKPSGAGTATVTWPFKLVALQ